MNKGFTLIELLAVIIILSIIATITLYATGTILKDAKSSLSDAQKEKIKEAAKLYYLENSSIESVCISELIEEGYLDGTKVLDPKDKSELTGYVLITKTNEGRKVTYEYRDDNEVECNTNGV